MTRKERESVVNEILQFLLENANSKAWALVLNEACLMIEKKFLPPPPKFKEGDWVYWTGANPMWGTFIEDDSKSCGYRKYPTFIYDCLLLTREEALAKNIKPPMVKVNRWEWYVQWSKGVITRMYGLIAENEAKALYKDAERLQRIDDTKTTVEVPAWDAEQ